MKITGQFLELFMLNSLYFVLAALGLGLVSGIFGLSGGFLFIVMSTVGAVVLVILLGMKYRLFGGWGHTR